MEQSRSDMTFQDRFKINVDWAYKYFARKIKEFSSSNSEFQHLKEWKLDIDFGSTSWLGLCDYGRKKIKLSYWFLRGATCGEKEIRDTILHEIAHAICGHQHGHNEVWKKVAKNIGCSGEVCGAMDSRHSKYLVYCKNKCSKFSLDKKMNVKNKICIKCKTQLYIKTLK